MDSIFKLWSDAMKMDEARWVVAIFGLVTCVLISYYFVKLFRDMALGGGDSESVSHLADFQRLHSEGKLAPYEYDQLKKTIPKHIGSQNSNGTAPDATQPNTAQSKSAKTLAEIEGKIEGKSEIKNEGVDEPDFSEVDDPDSSPDDTDEFKNEIDTTDEVESEQDTNGNK